MPFRILTVAIVIAAAIAPPLCAQSIGMVPHDTFTIASRVLGEMRLINVHVPAGRAATTRAPLPVLYMPDGGMDEDFVHVTHAVDSLVGAGRIKPVIVVGIPNTQRRRDLTPPTRVKSDSAIAPRVGESRAFRQFIRDELIPEIDRRYRVTDERSIIGESLAGLFVMETFLHDPQLFTHYVALDPSLWWNGGAMVDSAQGPIARLDRAPRSLFLATSKEPSTAGGAAKIDSLLRETKPRGLRWAYLPRTDLEHSNIFRSLEAQALTAALR